MVTFFTGIEIRPGGATAATASSNPGGPVSEGVRFVYQRPTYPTDGPPVPGKEGGGGGGGGGGGSGSRERHLPFVRPATESERPAGFGEDMACARALGEAMAGLFFSNSSFSAASSSSAAASASAAALALEGATAV